MDFTFYVLFLSGFIGTCIGGIEGVTGATAFTTAQDAVGIFAL